MPKACNGGLGEPRFGSHNHRAIAVRLDALELKKGERERIVWDDEIKGLGIRMRAGGSRNWVFQYKIGDKHRRMTIGAVSAVLSDAAHKILRGRSRIAGRDLVSGIEVDFRPARRFLRDVDR